jgi:hypothetical protein
MAIAPKKPDKDMGPEVKNLGGYRPGARLDAKPELNRAIGYFRHVELVICSPNAQVQTLEQKEPRPLELTDLFRPKPSR